jgi:hypothetical protein
VSLASSFLTGSSLLAGFFSFPLVGSFYFGKKGRTEKSKNKQFERALVTDEAPRKKRPQWASLGAFKN